MNSPNCSICHKKTDQLLILSCSHDLCIDCSVSHFFTGAEYRKNFQFLREANYWCQVCYEPTVIDKITIQLLNSHFNKINNTSKALPNSSSTDSLSKSKSLKSKKLLKSNEIINQCKNNPYYLIPSCGQLTKSKKCQQDPQHEVDTFVKFMQSQEIGCSIGSSKFARQTDYSQQRRSLSKDTRNNKLKNNSMKNNHYCTHHIDQPQTYYCFTCGQPICVQCALHGSHVGHQVQAIKKATTKLKLIYDNMISQSQKYRVLIENNIKELEKIIQNFQIWNTRHNSIIKQKFNQLYEILIEKEKSIINQINDIEKNSIKQLYEQKTKQQKILLNLKLQRKKLKKSLNQQSIHWNTSQLQQTKNQLKQLCEVQQSQPINLQKLQKQLKYVQTSLISQAIDTIEQLVSSFKLSFLKNNQQATT